MHIPFRRGCQTGSPRCPQVEAKKDRSLSRRVQSLSRFLLEALNKEGSAGGWALHCLQPALYYPI